MDSVELLTRRTRELAEAGFGGVILECGGSDSFDDAQRLTDALAEAIAAAREAGGEDFAVWLDVLGAAAKNLLRQMPGAAASRLCIERCLGPADAAKRASRPDVLRVYCLSLREGQSINGLEMWRPEGTPLDKSDLLVAVSSRSAKSPGDLRDAALSDVDLLRPDVVGLLTQAACRTRGTSLAEQLGAGGIAGIVADLSTPGVAEQGFTMWTSDMPSRYQDRWGEDILPLLPLLWFDGPGAERFRWRFRSLAADLFRTHFLLPFAEWCGERGLKLTGHFDRDHALISQVLSGWGPVMRLFEPMHVPAASAAGIGSALASRQAASAARQMGRGRVRKDVFQESSPRNVFADFRAEADRALALGADMLVPASAPVSLRGSGKREVGSSGFIPAQAWWPRVGQLNRCLGRLCDLLGQGRRIVNVLVLSSVDSIMATANNPLPETMAAIPGNVAANAKAEEIAGQLDQVLYALEAHQIDFDLGDEEIIARHGKVQVNAFIVGQVEYTTVIVPPALSWRAETIKRLFRFVRKGGSLIAVRPIASLVDFEPNRAIEELADEYSNVYVIDRAGRSVGVAANRLEPRAIQIKPACETGAGSLVVQHRRTESRDLFFVVNTDREHDIEARVVIQSAGAVRCLDAWTPRITLLYPDEEKGGQAFRFTFQAGGSVLFAVGGEIDPTEAPHQRLPHATSVTPLDGEWAFQRLDPNLMPLSDCRISFDGGTFSEVLPVTMARERALEILSRDIDAGGRNDAETRAETRPKQKPPHVAVQVALAYEFESRIDGTGRSISIVVEPNEGMEVVFNREVLALATDEWFLDPGFKRLDVSGRLRRGPNNLEIRFPCMPGCVVEAPLLAGDFAVAPAKGGRSCLAEEPSTLRTGSWTDQGYPFYAGRMRYRKEFPLEIEEGKRYFVALGAPAAAVCSVRVGEQEPVVLPFHPWRLEITRLARNGVNSLEIDLASTLFNLYGPRDLSAKRADERGSPMKLPDMTFSGHPLAGRDRSALCPFGLIGGVSLQVYDPHAPKPVEPTSPQSEDGMEKDETAGRKTDSSTEPVE